MITTKEFIQRCEENGYKVIQEDNKLYIVWGCKENVACVSTNKKFDFEIHDEKDVLNDDKKKELLSLLYEYVMTPLNYRNSNACYRLFIENGLETRFFLGKNLLSNEYTLIEECDFNEYVQVNFTSEEILELPEKIDQYWELGLLDLEVL